MNSNEVEIYHFKEVKEILQIGKNKVYELFQKKDFPSYKIGKSWAVTSENFWNWLANYRKDK